jgi:hypothetical protein
VHEAALHDFPLAHEGWPEQEIWQLAPLQFTFCWHEFRPEQVTVLLLA